MKKEHEYQRCINERWMNEHASLTGGWTRAQLADLGVPWPPPPGWLKAQLGRVIPLSVAKQFEAHK